MKNNKNMKKDEKSDKKNIKNRVIKIGEKTHPLKGIRIYGDMYL